MTASDEKNTIKRDLRPCIVHIPGEHYIRVLNEGIEIGTEESETHKALFHIWNPVSEKGIVEYEDGTIHEVKPSCIRFIDDAISEYAFPEEEE